MTSHQNPAGNGSVPKERLDLYSFGHLEFLLGLSRAELRAMAKCSGGLYAPFCQRDKPQPFATKPLSGKTRLIDNPQRALKQVQKAINQRLLKTLVLPEHLLGGVSGKSIRDNVYLHIGAPCIVTIDIKKFFPSVTPVQVYHVWRDRLNCSPRIAAILTRLTTFRGYLPQGAPTSTLLANLVLSSADSDIRTACELAGLRYSIWVDDLSFSGVNTQKIVPTVVNALLRAGFRVRHRKLKIMGPGQRKTINKIVLSKIASVDKRYLSRTRAGIYNLRAGKVPEPERTRYVRALAGSINYIRLFQPNKAAKLTSLLHAAQLSLAETSTSCTAGR